MIDLRLKVKAPNIEETLVTRLRLDDSPDERSFLGLDSVFQSFDKGWSKYDCSGHLLSVYGNAEILANDVLMIFPGRDIGHRIIRSQSSHNTFLVTEQCDQLCIMCSQPPKQHHIDLFDSFYEAAILSPLSAVIGISGGEPLLHKKRLFEFFNRIHTSRPDLTFHVLSNGQHFQNGDLPFLNSEAGKQILWAIPIYSSSENLHDQIVGKKGAFKRLLNSILLFSKSTARIEIRTVVMHSNYCNLPHLADFITRYIPFAEFWSIMQMEKIGYGKMNWDTEFFDTSVEFSKIASALNIATGRGLKAFLYNFPSCTVPDEYRRYLVHSISDWKQKYEGFCENCPLQSDCGGFFQWYDHENGFSEVGIK